MLAYGAFEGACDMLHAEELEYLIFYLIDLRLEVNLPYCLNYLFLGVVCIYLYPFSQRYKQR